MLNIFQNSFFLLKYSVKKFGARVPLPWTHTRLWWTEASDQGLPQKSWPQAVVCSWSRRSLCLTRRSWQKQWHFQRWPCRRESGRPGRRWVLLRWEQKEHLSVCFLPDGHKYTEKGQRVLTVHGGSNCFILKTWEPAASLKSDERGRESRLKGKPFP